MEQTLWQIFEIENHLFFATLDLTTQEQLRVVVHRRWRVVHCQESAGYDRLGLWAISSVGERFPHTEEATGSIPVSPTISSFFGNL